MEKMGMEKSFHPSKEGFKDNMSPNHGDPMLCFHPSKEGFKVGLTSWRITRASSFHPSKEGFKGTPLTSDSISSSKFPSL